MDKLPYPVPEDVRKWVFISCDDFFAVALLSINEGIVKNSPIPSFAPHSSKVCQAASHFAWLTGSGNGSTDRQTDDMAICMDEVYLSPPCC